MPTTRRRKTDLPESFTAIDFETADNGRDSACSVALVKVVDLQIVERWYRLIRPPRRQILYTYIHGISWKHVAKEPTFAELWPDFARQIESTPCLVAHNAGFDAAVLAGCCAAAGIARPSIPFECTVKIAREVWDLYPTKLPDVCRHLKIPLVHHQAESDAEACAKIVLAAVSVRRTAATV